MTTRPDRHTPTVAAADAYETSTSPHTTEAPDREPHHPPTLAQRRAFDALPDDDPWKQALREAEKRARTND